MDDKTINNFFAEVCGQEGLCEAGVFALTPDGWELLRRQRFTQTGSALAWAKEEALDVRDQYVYTRHRISVLSDADGQNLEDVLVEYEEKRKSGDPDYNELPRVPSPTPPEIRKGWSVHMHDVESTGPCKAYVCAEIMEDGKPKYSVEYNGEFPNGADAHKWAEYYEGKLHRRKHVKAYGTIFSETPMNNAEAASEFKEFLEEKRRDRAN